MKNDKEKTEKIKAAIRDSGYTLRAFAAHIRVGYSTLANALNGSQTLTPALENHILSALSHVPVEDYFLFKIHKNNKYEFCGNEFLVTIHEPSDENMDAGLRLLLAYAKKTLRSRGARLEYKIDEAFGEES